MAAARGRWLRTAFWLLPLLLASACGDASTEVRPVPAAVPILDEPAYTVPVTEWRYPNGDIANHRHAAGVIDSSNVATLAPAWEFVIPGRAQFGAAAGGPLIADGVVYLQDLGSNVFALDLESGEVRWERLYELPIGGPNGPALGDGLLFAPRGGNHFIALDLDTGEEVWSVALDSDAAQPLALGDVVYASTTTNAHIGGSSGFVYAFDAETGEERWRFQVVEEGFWGDPELNSGGGVWYPPAADLERGLLYYGTGDPGPYPGTVDFPNAASRPGPNLYTSSVIALDREDGSLRWHHQAVERGLFDHDLQSSPILASVEIGGERRQVLVGAGKAGRVLALDLETRELLWDVEVGVHQNSHLTELPPGEEVEVYPGIFGGVETPLALAGGLLYVPVVNMPTTHTADGHGALDGSSALRNAGSNTAFREGRGELVALRLDSGEQVWRVELGAPIFGGATVVNDLVFTSTFDGVIYAFHRETGEERWRYEAPGGINAWPAVAGDTIVWAVGVAERAVLIAFRPGGGDLFRSP